MNDKSPYSNKDLEVSFPVEIKHIQVITFAKAMDEVLVQNDHKGGWWNCDIQYLRDRLVEEMGEYFAIVASGSLSRVAQDLHKKELIDIANFAMMLWDRS